MGNVPYQERLRLFAGRYPLRQESERGVSKRTAAFYSTCPNEKEFQMLLGLENGLDFAFEKEGGCGRPVILSIQ